MPRFKLQIVESDVIGHEFVIDGQVECGRCDLGEPPPFAHHKDGQLNRLIIASAKEMSVPRRWFKISRDADGTMLIANLHTKFPIRLKSGDKITPASEQVIADNGEVVLSRTHTLRVVGDVSATTDVAAFRTLNSVLDDSATASERLSEQVSIDAFSGEQGKSVAQLLRIALRVVTDAVGSNDFLESATRAATDIVKLDRAAVLQPIDFVDDADDKSVLDEHAPQGWQTLSQFCLPDVALESVPAISKTMLDKVRSENTTKLHASDQNSGDVTHSLRGIHCAVASPITNSQNEVIAVLFGDRWTPSTLRARNAVSDLEGTLVDVLAGTIATGIARQNEAKLRSNLAGFFSPRVADILASDKSPLQGQDAEVSVLFCDIRGFSSVTEELGPQKTIDWINDVLGELSQCVVDRDGVLVDYVGDELMAMWGAPGKQEDHAARALQCAMAMLDAIEVLRVRWQKILPSRFGAGIGVNTGPARVGNVGSKLKFKYGVLGNTVNFGSRLQSATKQLGVGCLASAASVKAANWKTGMRRLAKLNVVGIEQAADVYQICADDGAIWQKFAGQYESALNHFEQQEFGQAARQFGEILQENTTDCPSMLLLSRTLDQLTNPSADFSPVLTLSKK